jgi:multicomponent Na+:H+ antiporter subunit C
MEAVFAILVGLFFAAGIYLMLSRHIIRILLGVVLFGNAVNLLIFTAGRHGPRGAAGHPRGGLDGAARGAVANPLPQALILTAIVISFSFLTFLLVLAYRAYQELGTDDTDEHACSPSPSPSRLPPMGLLMAMADARRDRPRRVPLRWSPGRPGIGRLAGRRPRRAAAHCGGAVLLLLLRNQHSAGMPLLAHRVVLVAHRRRGCGTPAAARRSQRGPADDDDGPLAAAVRHRLHRSTCFGALHSRLTAGVAALAFVCCAYSAASTSTRPASAATASIRS